MEGAASKITVRLPSDLLTRLDAAARERHIDRSAFVRQALAAQLPSVPGNGEHPSLYDVLFADGVLGRFTGPPGLSTTSADELRAQIHARVQRDQHDGTAER